MKLNKKDLPSTDGFWEYNSWSSYWISKLSGRIHNSLGPAIVYDDGSKQWYINGKIHRLDGPAIEYSNGQKEWYVNDVHLRKKDFSSAVISFLLGVDSEIAKLVEQEMKK